ncbi:serine hydrolase [Skermanella aerolata]|uniref:Serine hydrolase n=1 Tax=Skermanella aerolata TaxID=393310 RepID=A0A512DTX6_9PROT|nr:serine hydrolase [Skermanella aerolata]KJB92020.1 6-aminohexanoate-dimer hydrolase [Skermanella aerolata KACC 11604]GEO39918.1 serine hydrolase [Skermanella aerolata]
MKRPAQIAPPAPNFHRRDILKVAALASFGAALPWNHLAQAAEAPASVPVTSLDPALLARAQARAARLDQLNGLIVGLNGDIVLGEAFRGPALDRPVNVKSVSKTIVATLAGMALDRAVLSGVDQPLADIMPELVPSSADPRVRKLTVAQLLTMQAGLEPTSGPNYGRWVESPNWIAFALGRPFVTEPGERMLYSTGSYHVLGAALARASKRSLLALTRDWLADPLGIAIQPWTRDPQGFYMGGNNMALSPLALFRFGEMWRSNGLWQGSRVLSTAWIETSWQPRARSPFSGDDYGYGWFLTEARGRAVAYARGYGGQMVYVVPSLGLTVVVTSDPTRPARSGGYISDLYSILADDIIPAAEAG